MSARGLLTQCAEALGVLVLAFEEGGPRGDVRAEAVEEEVGLAHVAVVALALKHDPQAVGGHVGHGLLKDGEHCEQSIGVGVANGMARVVDGGDDAVAARRHRWRALTCQRGELRPRAPLVPEGGG